MSTAVYAPEGYQPSKQELSLIVRAANHFRAEISKWHLAGANIVLGPVVLKLKRETK